MKRTERKEEKKRRRKRRREDSDSEEEKEEQSGRIKVGQLNTKKKSGEDSRRRTYIHNYVLSSNWPDTVLICLVSMLKRKWELPVDADDLNLFEELGEYLFLDRE